MRVLFWGTPEFATPCLRALLGEGFDVVGVVTRPDKPQGRSRSRLHASPVKQVALADGLPVLQPERPRVEEFLAQVGELAPDISVVVAYGHILKREVIELPRHGTVNVHASLLPQLRGAAPIQAAIRAGLTETGVTIMQMVEELDAGPILHQLKTPIAEDETYGELALRLSELGALALVEALSLLALGAIKPRPQDENAVTHAPKLARDDARIDWNAPAREVAQAIRAYDPAPGAFTTFRDSTMKLFRAQFVRDASGRPGTVLEAGVTLTIACADGAVRIHEVQPAGRKRMPVAEWVRGRAIATGAVLGA